MSKNGQNQYETIGATYWTSVHWQRHIMQCLSLVMPLVFPTKGNQQDHSLHIDLRFSITHIVSMYQCINVSMYRERKKTALQILHGNSFGLLLAHRLKGHLITSFKIQAKALLFENFYIWVVFFMGKVLCPMAVNLAIAESGKFWAKNIWVKRFLKRKAKLTNLSSWINCPFSFCLTLKQREKKIKMKLPPLWNSLP